MVLCIRKGMKTSPAEDDGYCSPSALGSESSKFGGYILFYEKA